MRLKNNSRLKFFLFIEQPQSELDEGWSLVGKSLAIKNPFDDDVENLNY